MSGARSGRWIDELDDVAFVAFFSDLENIPLKTKVRALDILACFVSLGGGRCFGLLRLWESPLYPANLFVQHGSFLNDIVYTCLCMGR